MTYFISEPRTKREGEIRETTHVGGLILPLDGVFDGLADVLFDERVLLARPPVRDLREASATEVRVEDRVGAPVCREE